MKLCKLCEPTLIILLNDAKKKRRLKRPKSSSRLRVVSDFRPLAFDGVILSRRFGFVDPAGDACIRRPNTGIKSLFLML